MLELWTGLIYRECFAILPLAGKLARVSNSGLGWFAGQAYIKGLRTTTQPFNVGLEYPQINFNAHRNW